MDFIKNLLNIKTTLDTTDVKKLIALLEINTLKNLHDAYWRHDKVLSKITLEYKEDLQCNCGCRGCSNNVYLMTYYVGDIEDLQIGLCELSAAPKYSELCLPKGVYYDFKELVKRELARKTLMRESLKSLIDSFINNPSPTHRLTTDDVITLFNLMDSEVLKFIESDANGTDVYSKIRTITFKAVKNSLSVTLRCNGFFKMFEIPRLINVSESFTAVSEKYVKYDIAALAKDILMQRQLRGEI